MELPAQHHSEGLCLPSPTVDLVQEAFLSVPRYPCSPSNQDAVETSGFLSKADSQKHDTVFSLVF